MVTALSMLNKTTDRVIEKLSVIDAIASNEMQEMALDDLPEEVSERLRDAVEDKKQTRH
jgi:5,10-methenyltetrahydromethanopterin hydrogenase